VESFDRDPGAVRGKQGTLARECSEPYLYANMGNLPAYSLLRYLFYGPKKWLCSFYHAMYSQYELVQSSDDTPRNIRNSHSHSCARPPFAAAVIAVLSLANILSLGFTFFLWRDAAEAATAALNVSSTSPTSLVPPGLAKVDTLPVNYVPFRWNTPWGAPNATEADPLWDNINTAHGHIVVDHAWAAENNVSHPYTSNSKFG
jgi:hypothetical protein